MSRRNKCLVCGNNPASPHFLYWYFESLNIALAPLRRRFLNNPLSRLCERIANRFDLSRRLVSLGVVWKIIALQPEMEKCGVARARVLWQEAAKRGILMKELLLFGRAFDVYSAERSENPKVGKSSGNKIVFSGLPRPADCEDQALEWMDDKWLLKSAFLRHGLPAPQGGSVWNWPQAKKIFSRIRQSGTGDRPPAIVKPRAGSRGRHTTTFVSTLGDLRQAFRVAKQLCFWVIVEEQLAGPVYRATLVNYELCGVLRGDPPSVVGDGTHSIRALIAIKNSTASKGVKEIAAGPAMERFLERQPPLSFSSHQRGSEKEEGIRLDDIPAPGQTVNLSEKIGVNYGGASSEDFDLCHPDNRELFVRAAKILGDPIVGFDFIIPDIAKSWQAQKCGFLEANSLPFINLHHDPLYGLPRNVAAKVWDLIGL